jgi:hypothetical protein
MIYLLKYKHGKRGKEPVFPVENRGMDGPVPPLDGGRAVRLHGRMVVVLLAESDV